jgi:2-dehydro-3-deoxy-D-gluconate 5-dehydrogenase
VLVTGGGRGLGRAVALAFADEGARVAVVSRTRSQVEAVAAEIASLGARGLALTGDVSQERQVGELVARVLQDADRIDVLVNCAGSFQMGPSSAFAVGDLRRLLDGNLVGTFLMCREVGRHMLERGQGKIVNVASLLSYTAFPERAGYAASKGGVLALTRVLGVEWAARGVNVNAVAPGMIRVETPHPGVAAGALGEDDIVRRTPAGRRGRPADVVGPVLFLASPDADFIVGQSLVVDGGWLSYGYL